MIITEQPGDLTQSHCQTWVCPVNTVGTLGKGLALAIKRRYPEIDPPYRQACRDGRLVTGHCVLIPTHDGRQILMFPTKRHWRKPSQIEWIEWGLQHLIDEATFGQFQGITSLAVPPLGCGLGGLDYTQLVRPLLYRYLDPWFVDVELFSPQPVEHLPLEPQVASDMYDDHL